MIYLIIIMVMSVFMGTELLAIPTPAIQLSIYRITIIICWILTFYQISKSDRRLKIDPTQSTLFMIGVYIFWWLWAIISGTWAIHFVGWFRATFLISLGVSAIVLIYFWVSNLYEWHRVIQAMWIAMSGLVVWGYYELITNNYIFADLGKLDKHNTFASQPLSRIPVTVFENQNDFATMLLAYIVIATILKFLSTGYKRKFMYGASIVFASYLIFRSESRMILIGFIFLFLLLFVLNYKIDIKASKFLKFLFIIIVVGIFLISVIPPLASKISTIFYFGYGKPLNGDTVRVNLWRNGLGFLGKTFGFGVGAGNIEMWMDQFRVLPTKIITNMHNWWLEILVGYGIIAFIAYVSMYGSLIYQLYKLRNNLSKRYQYVNNCLISFLVVYIFASITSANNILIEWHWIFFGMIISYIKLIENNIKNKARIEYEY